MKMMKILKISTKNKKNIYFPPTSLKSLEKFTINLLIDFDEINVVRAEIEQNVKMLQSSALTKN